MTNIHHHISLVKNASKRFSQISESQCNTLLHALSQELINQGDTILQENAKDLATMPFEDPRYDRLQLTKERIQSIAHDVAKVAALPSPLHQVLLERTLPNGLYLQKVTIPLGVIGIIYEARPNVTIDVFSLCFKSGNACILKGGKEAHYSNTIFVTIIKKLLQQHNMSPDLIYLMPPERETVHQLLHATGLVDACIPRGSQALINFVRDHAKIPVIETGAGIVHTYFDVSGDLQKGIAIILNAKTRRVSVCNALDTLLIHNQRLQDLPALVGPLADKKVEIFADMPSYQALEGFYPAPLLRQAAAEDFGREFLSLKMAIKTVASAQEAIDHITLYTSGHSEAIIAEAPEAIELFLRDVDAAAVYVNASTAFTDGGEFGMGAEIGISTQKLHARGPMGLDALTSYKWIIRGNGQIRS
jgi:glutamate-5-semialdehyde dehydrogenase